MKKKHGKKTTRFRRILLGAGGFFALAFCAFCWWMESNFSLSGNLYLLSFQKSRAPLQINTRAGWKTLPQLSSADALSALELLHQKDGITVQRLSLRRASASITQSAADLFLPSELMVFHFAPDSVSWEVGYAPGFQPENAARARERADAVFAINASFFDPDGKPLGRVIHRGQEVNRAFPAWSGYFFVRDGKPFCGPKSLFESVSGPVEEAVQVYPSIMKDHTVFSYVELQPDRFFDGEKITYRSLAGMKSDGSILLIVSGKGGILNVSEMADLASRLNVRHATMMDGGRALQYEFQDGDWKHAFHSFNTRHELPWKQFNRVLCPVYLTARPRAPKGEHAAGSSDSLSGGLNPAQIPQAAAL